MAENRPLKRVKLSDDTIREAFATAGLHTCKDVLVLESLQLLRKLQTVNLPELEKAVEEIARAVAPKPCTVRAKQPITASAPS